MLELVGLAPSVYGERFPRSSPEVNSRESVLRAPSLPIRRSCLWTSPLVPSTP